MHRLLRSSWSAAFILTLFAAVTVSAQPTLNHTGNRLTYLDSDDPFYPNKDFPKLITPQWVGEPGVDAVVILAIDDMRETKKYETFLRPILERLKQIDGRAPVSIMVNAVAPDDPQLQTWLKEGLSLEVHTLAHPCPLLQKSNFIAAAQTYHGGVDLLNQIPGNQPVAFRMPCCDSMNSPSPRFYAEIFNRTSPAGKFLGIDSSVMNITTPKDTSLPRELVLDADGREKFRKYLTAETNATRKVSMKSFVTTIEDYPYPYVIGKLCWEFPCPLPSDWEAFNLHGATNPITLADWKASLDVTVLKQGVMPWIFHPHGWSSPAQIVEFIDYAVQKYGKRVKFLTFKEAQERLNKNLLTDEPLRDNLGGDNGIRLLDVNNDGYLDVLVGGFRKNLTRVWLPQEKRWQESRLPRPLISRTADGTGKLEGGVRFGVVRGDGRITMFHRSSLAAGARDFDGTSWVQNQDFFNGLESDGNSFATVKTLRETGRLDFVETGVRLRDIDHDGRCELIVANPQQQAIFSWDEAARTWKKLPDTAWPKGVAIVNERGEDNGVRFADINGDGYEDLIYSNEKEFGVWLYIATPKANLGWEKGWSFKLRGGQRQPLSGPAGTLSPSDGERVGVRGASAEIPSFVRSGTNRNNGAWFHSGHLWIQNEDTASLPDKVDRRSFKELLVGEEPPPMTPEQSLAAMKIRPGFKAELVASEPLVMDPVAFDWGADGKLWVVEMADYPRGIDDKGKPGGRIVFLEDTDADGKYDKRTVFLDGVNFPNGIICWRKGILVSAAPDVFYAEDTDGDGKADVKKVLFTGFREGNQQHRINGFEYGLDNWVYAANGDSGGQIVRVGGVLSNSQLPTANSQPIDIRGYDIRFKPDTGEIDLVAGQTQFGRRRDDWGNWFGNNNPTWLWHYHIPIHYLKRNPYLAVKSTRTVTAAYSPPNQVFTTGKAQQRFNWPDRVNQTTSACSPCPYRDELFGPDFATSVFISEPANNVVHREVLEPDGVTFKSRRAPDEQGSEFIASADKWFRPTMLKTGPDGALWIADMYRLIIEHPEYFPEELKNRPDMRDGDDKGRLWRVYPVNATPRKIPRLDKLNTAELVAAMDSPNGWQRDVAQRMLVERQDKAVVETLEALAKSAKNAKVRLQTLCALDAFGTPSRELLTSAMRDVHPEVRIQAIRIAEPQLAQIERLLLTQELPFFGYTFATLVDQEVDPRVQFQIALSLGEMRDVWTGYQLGDVALKRPDDPLLRTAVMSSAPRHLGAFVSAVTKDLQGRKTPEGLTEETYKLLGMMGDEKVYGQALDVALASFRKDYFVSTQFSIMAAFMDALDTRRLKLPDFANSTSPSLQQIPIKMEMMWQQARESAMGDTNTSRRLAAIRLLGRGLTEQTEDLQRIGALLAPQIPSEVQQAALTGLKRASGSRVAEIMLVGWKGYGPAIRAEVLDALLSRAEWTVALVSALETGTLATGEISAAARQKLARLPQVGIRDRSNKLFATVNADRQKVIKQYESVAELKGNAVPGRELFQKNCATCHRFNGEGFAVGPDLGSMADKSAASLLAAVLDPNQAVDAAYTTYSVTTKGDRELVGIIATETPNSVTMKLPGGVEETVLRTEIKTLASSRLSLMPEGLEGAMKPQDMADLIAYIRSITGKAP